MQERGNSIIETSLTELAFVFFFILLIFSAWKISDVSARLEETEVQSIEQKETITQLRKDLNLSSEFFSLVNDSNPEEIFNELVLGRGAVSELKKKKQELEVLETTLTELIENSGKESIEAVAESIRELEEAKRQIREKGFYKDDFVDNITDVLREASDFKGQNINLRRKLEKIGNGLDRPPCWADEVTGNIQYVFNVVINESNLEVFSGWPEARKVEAENNMNILRVVGKYERNSDLWEQSKSLFEESVAKECRHLVRVYDHAESKNAFKMYMLGIENHFYISLRKKRYE